LQQVSHTNFYYTLKLSPHCLAKFRQPNLFKNYKCNNLKHVTDHKNESVCLTAFDKLRKFNSLLSVGRLPAHIIDDSNATRQLHHQLRYGPFRGKDSASASSLRQCYAPMTDQLAAA